MSMSFEPTPQELAFFAKLEVKESIYPRIKRRRAADITAAHRKRLPDESFALPESRQYPIDTLARARNALARASQHATPEQIKRIRRAVHKRWPQIEMPEYADEGGGES